MNGITLLSDFGLLDATLANVKGTLMQFLPNTTIVDISHQVEPFHRHQAAYLLASCYKSFSPSTCHIVLFDLFYQSNADVLLGEVDGQYIITPDNGLLSLAFGPKLHKVWHCGKVNSAKGLKGWLHHVGALLQQLLENTPETLALEETTLKQAPSNWSPLIKEESIECHIIHIDRFENVIINITKAEFEAARKKRKFTISFMNNMEINSISVHYSDVKEGDKLCRFNATGFLEIAINRGKAASLLGFQLRQEKHLIYNTINIKFE